jgi:tetratricopeptide (TPR) repeat protein
MTPRRMPRVPWRRRANTQYTRAQRAVALDTDSAEAQAALGASLYLSGSRAEGREHILLALTLDSNSSGARFERGASLISDGNHSEGRSYILDTIRLDPRNPQSAKYLSLLAGSYYFEGEYESAIEVARRSLARYPAYPRALRWLAAALGQLGHSDDARSALCELTRVSSAMLDMYVLNRGFWRPEDHEHLLDGLRKAGWQC